MSEPTDDDHKPSALDLELNLDQWDEAPMQWWEIVHRSDHDGNLRRGVFQTCETGPKIRADYEGDGYHILMLKCWGDQKPPDDAGATDDLSIH